MELLVNSGRLILQAGAIMGAGFVGYAVVGNLSNSVKQSIQKIVGYNDFAETATTFSYAFNPPVYGMTTGVLSGLVVGFGPYSSTLFGFAAVIVGSLESLVRWGLETSDYYPPSLAGAVVSLPLLRAVNYLSLRSAKH